MLSDAMFIASVASDVALALRNVLGIEAHAALIEVHALGPEVELRQRLVEGLQCRRRVERTGEVTEYDEKRYQRAYEGMRDSQRLALAQEASTREASPLDSLPLCLARDSLDDSASRGG